MQEEKFIYNKKKNILKNLYDWVLHWAYTPYGVLALFLLSFAESSFFPIPPDILLIALAISRPKKSLYYALICSIASIIGGLAGYGIGHFFWYSGNDYSSLANLFFKYIPGFTVLKFNHVSALYNKYSFWVVFTAGFTPIPYKIITITAGVCKVNVFIFIIASAISRSARFFIVSILIYKFGPKIKDFIDKYFNLLSIAFMILLIGGFLIFKYVF